MGVELYRLALVTMKELLEQVNATYWASYIAEDINAWDREKDVTHHFNAFHKEGLSDLWICQENGHHIETLLGPWATCLITELCSFSNYNARKIRLGEDSSNITIDEVIEYRKKITSIYNKEYDLAGQACRKCGYLQISVFGSFNFKQLASAKFPIYH